MGPPFSILEFERFLGVVGHLRVEVQLVDGQNTGELTVWFKITEGSKYSKGWLQ